MFGLFHDRKRLQGAAYLSAVQRLDLRLFVHREHQGVLGRIDLVTV